MGNRFSRKGKVKKPEQEENHYSPTPEYDNGESSGRHSPVEYDDQANGERRESLPQIVKVRPKPELMEKVENEATASSSCVPKEKPIIKIQQSKIKAASGEYQPFPGTLGEVDAGLYHHKGDKDAHFDHPELEKPNIPHMPPRAENAVVPDNGYFDGNNEEKFDQEKSIKEREELEEATSPFATSTGSSVTGVETIRGSVVFASPHVGKGDAAGKNQLAPGSQSEDNTADDRHGINGQCTDDVQRNPEADNDRDSMACGNAVANNQEVGPSDGLHVPGPVIAEVNAPEQACQPARKSLKKPEIQVNVDICEHLLRDLSYNDREDLSDQLDNVKVGSNITDLIKNLLTVEELNDIWSSCHGGSDPPMNLLIHLAGKDCCTLADLRDHAVSAGQDRFKALIELIDTNENYLNTMLNDLDFCLLLKISELIRSKPYPTMEKKKPLWKRLASTAGLNDLCIANLDAEESRDPESLTVAFITYMNHTYPDATVAWLAYGLKSIKRHHILLDDTFGLFKKCKDEKCIITA